MIKNFLYKNPFPAHPVHKGYAAGLQAARLSRAVCAVSAVQEKS